MKNEILKYIGQSLLANIDEMAAEYAVLLVKYQPRWYGAVDFEELKRGSGVGLSSTLDCFIRGDFAPLDNYFQGCAHIKLNRGVGIGDVVEGTMLGKHVFLKFGRKYCADQDEYVEFLNELERFYFEIVTVTTERYSEMLLSKLNAEHVRNKLLLEASRTVTSTLDPDEALEKLAEVLAGTVDDGCCTIFLVNSETGGLAPSAGFGYASAECQRALGGLRLCSSGSSLRGVNGESYGLCTVNKASSSCADLLPEAVRSGSVSLFPITNGETTAGVALVSSGKKGFTFDDATTELIGGILNAVAVAIESAATARKTKRQLMESESLRRVANILLQSPEGKNGDVLALIVDEARGIISGTGSSILLQDGRGLNVVCTTGEPKCPKDVFSIEDSYYGKIFKSGKTAIISDAQSEIPAGECNDDVRTLIVVPLLEGYKKLGLLLVSNKSGGFDYEDKRIMEMFAAQAVLAIRNSRLFEQSEKLVVQGERQRLARELHDSVTQALYAITFCSDAAVRSLDSGRQSSAVEQLKALQGMAQQAMRDMRSLIFDLHPPELESEGLVGALQARLNAVEVRSGLSAELLVEGNERRLPLRIEEELFRIAIEALNNSTKHSKAESVLVKVIFDDGFTIMLVVDDGKGFNLETLPTGGMGLRGIRERAQRINAELEIDSTIDQGTSVKVFIYDKFAGRGGSNE
ncbi:GAF domain-containing sensor histidine kinase [Maridesulfovibrio hydrothermalis]|uniref:GAF sensor signal transduction histidine kinase n=1 Tax=Maridesulfovibrio hydrothermalis AM13 = DSM 14728 TaxID=1121451 RepID=L0RE14_9BACT|nr:GAF domain-containing sensor histidine kinase [Maridesulfovibrio hydrothermalis]CCO24415.1 GAF sensor signal transduction histidine kinase [Maridesulfovibrio hydrothermalis AM13 = DSM 14728]